MDGHVPVELVAPAAVLELLLQDPVAAEQPRIVLAEEAEPVADETDRLGAVLVGGADPANVAREPQAPPLAQVPERAQADDRIDPLLVVLDLPLVVDAEVREVELALQGSRGSFCRIVR